MRRLTTKSMPAILGLAFALASAMTARIPYTGGMQTGTFDLKGTTSNWNYADTVILDSNLRIASFTEALNERRHGYPGARRYWIFLDNPSEPPVAGPPRTRYGIPLPRTPRASPSIPFSPRRMTRWRPRNTRLPT